MSEGSKPPASTTKKRRESKIHESLEAGSGGESGTSPSDSSRSEASASEPTEKLDRSRAPSDPLVDYDPIQAAADHFGISREEAEEMASVVG